MIEIYNRLKKEDGAIAIITIAFLSTVGITAIIALWSIGIATGAYNKLYIANQTAAFSAATTARPEPPAAQPGFDCGAGQTNPVICSQGETFSVAEEVFRKSLQPGNRFGMRYATPGANVDFFSSGDSYSGFSPGAISVFEFAASAANAKRNGENSNLSHPCYGSSSPGRIALFYNGRACWWRVSEGGIQFPRQYNSGILTQARATIPTIPLFTCTQRPFLFGISNCVTIRVQAGASVGQTIREGYDPIE